MAAKTKQTTMFKLVGADGGVISTAVFGKFDDDPEKGRTLAEAHIRFQKERWSTQPMFIGDNLHIVEE